MENGDHVSMNSFVYQDESEVQGEEGGGTESIETPVVANRLSCCLEGSFLLPSPFLLVILYRRNYLNGSITEPRVNHLPVLEIFQETNTLSA